MFSNSRMNEIKDKSDVTYRLELDGLRGIACLIVLLGHSVACIFPSIYFGNTYESHSQVESFIHATPLNLLFNGSAMVTVFFVISGYLLGHKSKEQNIIDFSVKRYLRYLPMTTIGIALGAAVMWLDLAYSIRLADYSYAGNYVNNYNNFAPTMFGRRGVIYESLIKVFIRGSDYNNVLWYIPVSFLGEIYIKIVLSSFKNIKVKRIIMIVITVILWLAGVKIWQLQFLAGMSLGVLIALSDISMSGVKAAFCTAAGIFLLSIEDKNPTGIYRIFHILSNYTVPLWCIGSSVLLIGVLNCQKVSDFFSSKVLTTMGNYSFAVYVMQWPVIISCSCGLCYMLVIYGCNYNIAGIAGIAVGCIITAVLSVIYTKYIYTPLHKQLIRIWDKLWKRIRGC